MKLPILVKSSNRRRRGLLSGQILAEACIGLSLLVLLWIMLSFTTYMANNRIRTAMAVRDAVWLKSNGQDPTGTIPGAFFFGPDVNLAAVTAANEITLPLSLGSINIPLNPSSQSGTGLDQ